MVKVILEVDTFNVELVRTRRRVELDEWQLRLVLAKVVPEENPMCVEASELREYLDGIGQLATRVELTGAQQTIRSLLDSMARVLDEEGFVLGHGERSIVPMSTADDGDVKCGRAYTKLDTSQAA